jgi:hypothetical protein
MLTDAEKEVNPRARAPLSVTRITHSSLYLFLFSRINGAPKCSRKRVSGNSMRTCVH